MLVYLFKSSAECLFSYHGSPASLFIRAKFGQPTYAGSSPIIAPEKSKPAL
jgi:hypothetical protein